VTSDRWQRTALVSGALLAGLAVAAGAFGAHTLRTTLSAERLSSWETAARYQIYHALALVLTGLFPALAPQRLLRIAAVLFLCGIVLFSGSLYVLAVTDRRWLGAITPFGGVAFLAGWVCLAAGSLRRRPPPIT
jgi:uncharacterized membrane protein YgdD (TMEM256/DUF423 family)